MSKPIPEAVTAVLIHGERMYLAERQKHLNAFPGFHAFPGGKVDKNESLEPFTSPLLSQHPPRLMRALVREMQEELAFDLEKADLAGDVEAIIDVGVAIAPPQAPVRFHTHFFKVVLKEEPVIELDLNETASGEWATPKDLMTKYEQGELLLAPPTLAVLKALTENIGAKEVPGLHFENREFSELPLIEPLAGFRMIFVASNTLPPAIATNAFLLGDIQSHRVLVDPSPNSPEEFERLKALCQRMMIHEVFLTHHHPDHREYADELARYFNLPLGLSQDTYDRIKAKVGMKFFEGLTINTYVEGDVLCRWLGQPVRVIEVPGHDEGQLALMPDSRAWCIVGDLIQGVGTVVIAKPEGNMRKYFATLQKVIDLKPRVIFPSHGHGMGTTFRLEETLRHRQMREDQIKAYLAQGKQPDEMLPLIYNAIDPRLLPLARMNIDSHLDKIREDAETH